MKISGREVIGARPKRGRMAPKLWGGLVPTKIHNICCAIHDVASNEVNMADKVRKFEDFRQKSDGG